MFLGMELFSYMGWGLVETVISNTDLDYTILDVDLNNDKAGDICFNGKGQPVDQFYKVASLKQLVNLFKKGMRG